MDEDELCDVLDDFLGDGSGSDAAAADDADPCDGFSTDAVTFVSS